MSIKPCPSKSDHQKKVILASKCIKPIFLIINDDSRSFTSLPYFISSDIFSPMLVSGESQALHQVHNYKDRIRLILIDQKSSGLGAAGFMQVVKRIIPETSFLITSPLGPIFYHANRFYELTRVNLKDDIDLVLSAVADKTGLAHLDSNNHISFEQHRSFLGRLIGWSQEMNEIYKLIQTIEKSTSSVLIQGESGTGKELIAQTIHENSPRRDKRFVAINCCSIPSNLAESEFFGHEKGAFTSAYNLHKGKFEEANGGTLFLDEIGELEPSIQTKLLRFLQEKEFQRVGGNMTIHSNCRLITATNRNLYQDVIDGRFRKDLYYRINVIPIYVPPLRKRRQDLPLLLEHFFKMYTQDGSCPRLTEEALEALYTYCYPGNVRELINIVERISVTCPTGIIGIDDLPQEIRRTEKEKSKIESMLLELPEEGVSIQNVERELIIKTLEKTSGNKTVASRMLGITRRLLYLRLKEYGLISSATSV